MAVKTTSAFNRVFPREWGITVTISQKINAETTTTIVDQEPIDGHQ